MLYILALTLPPIACLGAGRFWHAVLSTFFCLTIILFPVAMIHAWLVVRGVEERKNWGRGNSTVKVVNVSRRGRYDDDE